MNLTLSLLVLARHLLAAPPVRGVEAGSPERPAVTGEPLLVDLIPYDWADRGATCAVGVDRSTDELLVSASPSTWNRLRSVFSEPGDALMESSAGHRDLVRIHHLGGGSAEALASELRALNPHLDIEADRATGSILVSSADALA